MALGLAVLWSVGLGGFLILTVLGGAAAGCALFLTNRFRRAPASVPDSFARDAFSTDTVNFAHVRVAGVGGVGLMIVALAMALDFALVGAVLLTGLIGGVAAAVVVILWRRRGGGPLPSSSSGSGARGVLFVETPAEQRERPRPAAAPDDQRRGVVTISA
jgi:hypothetical protein